MAPGTVRRGGRGKVIRTAYERGALDPMLVAATAKSVCFVAFDADEA